METASRDAPLLVTLQLDEHSAAIFDELRRQHYPPQLNKVGAHLTLFHHLPPEHSVTLLADLRDLCPPPFDIAVGQPRLLGRGVAVEVRSPHLETLHRQLAARWLPWLTRQDRRPFRPHITIQNKVDPAIARHLHAELSHIQHWPIASATGWSVWRYLGGPWAPVADIAFEPR